MKSKKEKKMNKKIVKVEWKDIKAEKKESGNKSPKITNKIYGEKKNEVEWWNNEGTEKKKQWNI